MIESIVIKNTVTNVEIPMDMTTTDYILQNIDLGVIESSRYSFKYVNQVGVTVTGVSLETREIKIIGWVAGETEESILQKKSILNRMINPLQPIDIFLGDYEIQMLPNTTIKYSNNPEENNEVMCKFQIDGVCADPMFRTAELVTATETVPKFMFPLIIPQGNGIVLGEMQSSLILSIENLGAVETGFKIEFTAKGEVVNPSIINIGTQEFIKIYKVMEAGEKITINTEDGKKKIIGTIEGEDSNYSKYRDWNSSWIQLSIGENLLRYSADENIDLLEVRIFYDNKYFEVQ